jgi:hypothetical protein
VCGKFNVYVMIGRHEAWEVVIAENERVATAERKAKQNVVEGTAAKFAVLGNFVTGIVRTEMNVGAPETEDTSAEEQQVELATALRLNSNGSKSRAEKKRKSTPQQHQPRKKPAVKLPVKSWQVKSTPAGNSSKKAAGKKSKKNKKKPKQKGKGRGAQSG